jgi:Phage head-tail joining protein
MAGLGSGNLDRDIILRTAEAIQSPSGDPIFDWENAVDVEVAAEWLPLGTREAWQTQNRLNTYIDGVFIIHYIEPRPAPDNTRIIFNGREYDIKPPMEVGREIGWMIPVIAKGD